MKPIELAVKAEQFELTNNLFLAEFDLQSAAKTEIIPVDEHGNKSASIKGITVYRLIDTEHKTVTVQDPTSLTVDLSALVGLDDVVLVCAHPPYNNITEYFWKLFKMAKLEDANGVFTIISSVPATEAQTKRLNQLFPKWLENVEKFDTQLAGDTSASSTITDESR